MTRWLATLAALFLAGCASTPLNPYLAQTREDGVELSAGNLRLVCAVGSPAAAERIQQAVQASVTAAGGGTVQALTGTERAHLLDLLRAKGGAAFSAKVRRYEAEIVARIRDSLAPMKVVWTLGSEAVSLNIDGDVVKLLEDEERPNKFKLLIDATSAGLTVPGDQIIRDPAGAGFRFKTPAFKIYLKAGSQRIGFRLVSESAELMPEDRMLFLEVTEFQGDVAALNTALLAQDVRRGEEPDAVRFVHYDTVLFLGAAVVTDAPESDEGDEDEHAPAEDGEGEAAEDGDEG